MSTIDAVLRVSGFPDTPLLVEHNEGVPLDVLGEGELFVRAYADHPVTDAPMIGWGARTGSALGTLWVELGDSHSRARRFLIEESKTDQDAADRMNWLEGHGFALSDARVPSRSMRYVVARQEDGLWGVVEHPDNAQMVRVFARIGSVWVFVSRGQAITRGAAAAYFDQAMADLAAGRSTDGVSAVRIVPATETLAWRPK